MKQNFITVPKKSYKGIKEKNLIIKFDIPFFFKFKVIEVDERDTSKPF